MSTKAIQLTLKEIMVEDNGAMKKKTGRNLLNFVLVYPREGVPSVSTVKSVDLKSQKAKSFGKEPFHKSVLFKETLNGPCELLIEVSAVDKPDQLDKFIQAVFKGIGAGVVKLATGGISDVIVGAVVEAAGNALFDGVKVDKEKLAIIGKASIVLDPRNLPSELVLPLVLERDVQIRDSVDKSRTKDNVKYNYRKIPKGENGYLKIAIAEL